MLTVHVSGAGGAGVLDELRRWSAGRVVAVDDPARAVLVDDGGSTHLRRQVGERVCCTRR